MKKQGKPRLYHGSSNKNIEIFEPRKETVRDEKEGPVIFATPDPAYASCFLVRTDDTWTSLGRWGRSKNEVGPWVKVVADRDRFNKADIGGTVYELPNETFQAENLQGTISSEWVSKVPVKPLESSLEFESGLDAMLEHGVQVFFLDQDTIDRIRESEDHGFSIIAEMQKKGLSENQRQGRNIVFIE